MIEQGAGERGALKIRLAANPNVESEEQKRPEQDCCNYGQHPANGPQRIEVVIDCGDDDADDDPDDREERWPPVPHDSLMLPPRALIRPLIGRMSRSSWNS